MSLKLSFCLKAATTLRDDDLGAITDGIEAYVRAGMSTELAEEAAVTDLLAAVNSDRADMVKTLREQHPNAFQRTPQTPAQRSAAAKARRAFNVETDSVLQAVAKMGGIRRDIVARDFGLKPEELKHTVEVGGLKGYPFRASGGLDLDRVLTNLQEVGYFAGVSEEDIRSKFEEAVYSELQGDKALTMEGQMRQAEEAAHDRLDQEEQAEREALMAESDLTEDDIGGFTDDDIDWFGTKAPADQVMRALGFSEQEIQDELAREAAQTGAGQDGNAAGEATAQAGATGSAEAGTAPAGTESRPDLTLAAPTRAEVLDQQSVLEKEQADKEAPADQPKSKLTGEQPDMFNTQGGLFGGTVNEPDAPYTTDLFGNALPDQPGKTAAKKPASTELRGDALAAAGLPADTPAPAGDYLTRTIVGSEVQRKLGAKRITTPAEAAAATRYLYASAVERLDGIVTDADGKPLAVVGGFKGALSQASIYPATLVGEAIRIKGAANIWFSHNHPSGLESLSRADEHLNQMMSSVFAGSGIEPRGLMAVAGNRFAHVSSTGRDFSSGEIPLSDGSTTVPTVERQLSQADRGPLLDSPDAAKAAAKVVFEASGKKPLIMLADSQNRIVAWVPITQEMQGKLRDTGGLAAIYRAVSESNAGSAFIVHGGELDAHLPSSGHSISQNIASALRGIDVKPLDSINATTGKSAAERGEGVTGGVAFSLQEGDLPTDTPGFKNWSQGAQLVTSEAATTHKFKTGQPVVVEAFHGTKRPDRVGTRFKASRATSGPMAFHTSDPALASNYATGKADTSLSREEVDYPNWFQFKQKGDRSAADIVRAWYRLTPEQKDKVAALAPRVMYSEEQEADGGNKIVLGPESHKSGTGSYDHNLSETQRGYDKRGNPMKALVEDWLNRGNLFDDEVRFMQVLKLAGFPVADVTFDSPNAEYPFVYKNYLAMQRPLVTSDIPQSVHDALAQAAKRDRSRAQPGGDMRDKNGRTLRDWVAQLNGDAGTYAWTSIPDKVTDVLRALGYDGIIDWSGKGGGNIVAPVYIPFRDTQIKSAIGNKGTFDPMKGDIRLSNQDLAGGMLPVPEVIDAGPASAQDAAAVALLEKQFRAKVEAFKALTLQALPRVRKPGQGASPIAQMRYAAADLAEKMFGKRVVFFSSNIPFANGMQADYVPGSVFINEGTSRPIMAVLGHELLHSLRQDHQALYAKLADRLGAMLEEPGRYHEQLNQRRKSKGLPPLPFDKLREELIADIVGDNFTDPAFWRKVSQGQPSLFGRVLRVIRDFLDNLLSKLRNERPYGTDKYLNDIQGARDAVVEAMREFANHPKTAAAATTTAAGANLSETNEPFYSELSRQVSAAKMNSAPAQGWADWLKGLVSKGTIKADEIAWTGLDDWLKMQDGKISREQVHQFLDANGVKVTETTLRKVGGGPLTQIDIGARDQQPGFDITPAMREKAAGGLPMFSLAPNVLPPAEGWARAFQRKLQDNFNRFTTVRKWATEHGANMTPESNVWAYEERMHGRIASRVEDFREKRVKPAVAAIQKAGFTMEQVAEFLHAQHAAERNKQVGSIPGNTQSGSGMTDAEAAAILAAADPKLAALANDFRKITDETQDILLKAGIISQDTVDAWSAAYKNYVPLKGGDDAPAAKTGTGKGLNVSGKQKRALGHDARQESIIENIMRDHERAITLAEKNRVGHSLLAFIADLANDDIATIGEPEKRKVLRNSTSYEVRDQGGMRVGIFDSLEGANKFISKHAGGLFTGTLTAHAVKGDPTVSFMASPMLQDNEVNVYVDGYTVRVQLKDDLLARAYTRSGTEGLNKLLAMNREINNFLSKAYTGYNPEFLATNVIRDFTTGLINVTGKFGATVTARAVRNYPTAFATLIRYSVTGKETPAIKAYRDAGGSTGSAYLGDLERIGKDVQASYDEYRGVIATLKGRGAVAAGRTAARKMAGTLLALLEHLNAAGESAMRLSVFESVRTTPGYTVDDAASAAKNSTVNFNRKGELGPTLGALYLFFNPSIQGTAAILDTLVNGQHKAQAWALAGSLGALSYALAAGQFGGGEDDDEFWLSIPDSTKDKNIIIRTGKSTYKTIPVPYGYGFIYSLGNSIYALQKGRDAAKVSLNMASNLFEHFSPIGNPIGDKLDVRGLGELVPGAIGGELMRDAVRVATNRSGLGSDIVPDSPFDKEKPDNLKLFRSTKGSIYEKVATAANAATGGTKSLAGGVDVSPETLKFWARAITGGSGAFLADFASMTKNTGLYLANPTDPDREALWPDAREIPIVRRFAKEETVQDRRRMFWEAVNEVEGAKADLVRARKSHDEEAMQSLSETRGELLAMGKFTKGYIKAVKAARDEVDAIMADETTSLAFKRARSKEIEDGERQIYNDYVRAFTQARTEARKQREAATQ